MWISRKHYDFLVENAEKNIDAECAILAAKEAQNQAVARAMEEYSAVLKERDDLKAHVAELEYRLEQTVSNALLDIHPCTYCNTGWGSISSKGSTSCHDTCERLRRYNERNFLRIEPQSTLETSDIPNCCKSCSNHPSNGGSGICNCTAPYFEQNRSTTANTLTSNIHK